MNDPAPFSDSTVTQARLIGQGIDRVEDARLLRGAGAFVDDLHLPGQLHAVVLRSAVAHGRLLRVDVTAARAMPGVRDAFAAAEVIDGIAGPGRGTMPRIPMLLDPLPEAEPFLQPVIAVHRVRYVGEPLAVVVAETQALAEDALEAIAVEIEALAAVVDGGLDADDRVLLSDSAGSNAVVRLEAVRGDASDIEALFRSAPHVRRERFRVHRHFASPIETRGLLARRDAGSGRLVVSGAAKMPFANRRILAGLLGLPEDTIDLIEGDTGGAFGQRGEFYPEDFLVPFAALRCGQPVKWIEDRRENLIAANHAREADCELEVACMLDGRLLALRGRAATDVGAYLRTTGLAQSRNLVQVATGPYRVPTVALSVDVRVTNKTPSGPYRGPGRFETDFFRERLFDIVAGELGIDRVEFRRRNLLHSGEMPWPLPTLLPWKADTATDSGDYAQTLDRCLQVFDWTRKLQLNGSVRLGRPHVDEWARDRRTPAWHRRRLLHRRRCCRPARRGAPGARGRWPRGRLHRVLAGRTGARDRVCTDRRRRARPATHRDPRRVPWFDHRRARRFRQLQLAQHRDGRLGDRDRREEPAGHGRVHRRGTAGLRGNRPQAQRR